jgi:molybdate transport repressor ModE-like protein
MNDRLELRIRILLGSSIAIGPGKAALLEAIGDTGSIAAAGRRMGMSFRRACLLAKTMNACFRRPLVDATNGGLGAGGRRAAAMYSLIETAKLNAINPQTYLADVLSRVADHPAKRVTELLPWNWQPANSIRVAA